MNEPEPTLTWTCDCGEGMYHYRGEGDQSCPRCGQWFNAFGQPLREDWTDNPSTWDDDIDDLEGFSLGGLDRDAEPMVRNALEPLEFDVRLYAPEITKSTTPTTTEDDY